MEGATEEQLRRVGAAVGRRARELGLSPEQIVAGNGGAASSPPTSEVLRRVRHADGELTLETRATRAKDGTVSSRRGPYWYFHFRDRGRQRTIYLGKCEVATPAEVLERKRGSR